MNAQRAARQITIQARCLILVQAVMPNVLARVLELVMPDDDDYFVLKPMHSGFFSTTLEVLLERLEAERLILVGFAADIFVLYTANDAYMRGFKVAVPSDCVASETKRKFRFALEHMSKRLKADTKISDQVRFS